MIAEAPAVPAPAAPGQAAAPAGPATPGSTAPVAAAPGAAAMPPGQAFLPLLLEQASGPPGDGKPKGKGARTAQSEGADKHTDTASTEPAAAAAPPLAAALLQVPLPVPVSGAPPHTDDAQEQGAGAPGTGAIRTLPLPPGGLAAGGAQAAAAGTGGSQLSQDAAVDATRPVPEPANATAARTNAGAQLGGKRPVGETASPPRVPILAGAGPSATQAAPAHPGHGDAKATAPAGPAVLSVATVDAASAPSGATAAGSATGSASTPTAFARLDQLPASTAALLEVATGTRATRARIVLTPPELGTVEVRLRYGADGVTAVLRADSPQAAQSLAGAAGDLRRSLETQGIPIVRIDVPPAPTGGAAQQGAPWASGGGDPSFARARGDRPGRGAASSVSVPDDPITLRAVLLGTSVDVLA